MNPKLANVTTWLPYAASAFALVLAIVILSDAGTTIVLNELAPRLSESPMVMRYTLVHFATGATLFAGAVIALIAMEARSRGLLVVGELFASAALATIVVFERMSLWALPYLDSSATGRRHPCRGTLRRRSPRCRTWIPRARGPTP